MDIRGRLYSVIPLLCYLDFSFLFVLYFESPAYYRRWGFNGRFEVS